MSSYTEDEADDLLDSIQTVIDEADDDEGLEGALSQLEDLILEEVVAGGPDDNAEDPGTTSTPTSSTTPHEETFIQQKSLALLPLLCRFPWCTSEASSRILKSVILVANRGNSKESWLAIDAVLETARTQLQAMQDFDDDDSAVFFEAPERLVIYLSRALVAAQIVIPRVQARNRATFVASLVQSLFQSISALSTVEVTRHIDDPDIFAPTLLFVNVLKCLSSIHTWVSLSSTSDVTACIESLRQLYLRTISVLLPLSPESVFLLHEAKPETSDLEAIILETAQALGLIEAERDLRRLLFFYLTPATSSHTQGIGSIVLAAIQSKGGALSEVSIMDALRAIPRMLASAAGDNAEDLARPFLSDAILSLATTAAAALRQSSPAPSERWSAVISTTLQTFIQQFDTIAAHPPAMPTVPAPARILLDLIQSLATSDAFTTEARAQFLESLLNDNRPHIRAIAVGILRSLFLGNELSAHDIVNSYGILLLDDRNCQQDLLEPRTHRWVISALNLLYLLFSRQMGDLRARYTGSLVNPLLSVKGFLDNLRKGIALTKSHLQESEIRTRDPQEQMQLDILEDTYIRTLASFERLCEST